ncbi:MAG: HNH endonuclease [Calditrichaceae bacterium]
MTLNRHVLVLNQNFEPLLVCNAKKAIVLIYLSKAQLLEHYNMAVHSVSMSIPYPSVIRLNHYVRKPYKRIVMNRKNILRRDHNTCQYCGKNSQPMTIDHVIPKSYQGDDTWENLVCACLKCNTKKGNRTPEQAGMSLLKVPGKPSHLFFLQYLTGKIPPAWKPYMFLN